mgnify:CR=1 FL=1
MRRRSSSSAAAVRRSPSVAGEAVSSANRSGSRALASRRRVERPSFSAARASRAAAETDLARYDKLEELLRQETEARGKAKQEQTKAQTHREALAALDKTLAALREEQGTLANAEAERVKLETQSKELTQRGKALRRRQNGK